MPNESPKHGIVGFFDILGYSSFLENNPVEMAVEVIRNFQIRIPEEVTKRVTDMIPSGSQPASEESLSLLMKMKWLVFSDTIVIALSYDASINPLMNYMNWLVFFPVTMVLNQTMFQNGLPLRGAISFGEFYMESNFLAGKPFVEAHRMANNLDLCACVLNQSAKKEYEEMFGKIAKVPGIQNPPNLAQLTFDYLVPLKDGSSMRLPTLGLYPGPDEDIPQIVSESFWKHKKEIPAEAISKLNNTVLFLRYVKMQKKHN